jgi:hypothetical protein
MPAAANTKISAILGARGKRWNFGVSHAEMHCSRKKKNCSYRRDDGRSATCCTISIIAHTYWSPCLLAGDVTVTHTSLSHGAFAVLLFYIWYFFLLFFFFKNKRYILVRIAFGDDDHHMVCWPARSRISHRDSLFFSTRVKCLLVTWSWNAIIL